MADIDGVHVCYDMKVKVTGVHAAGTTTWTSPVPGAWTKAIRRSTGEEIDITQTGPTTFTAAGDKSGEAWLCEPNEMAVALSPVIPRGEDGAAIAGSVLLTALTLLHRNKSAFKVASARRDGLGTAYEIQHTHDFTAADPAKEHEFMRSWPSGRAEDVEITIESVDWRPVEINALEYEGNYARIQR